MTKASLAASLADLLGIGYAGSVGFDRAVAARSYAVPCDTLARHDARRLGIEAATDLFGGVVPLPFMATKIITHPLVSPDAQAPPGWVPQFAEQVGAVVLPGLSAFDAGDARRACERLLQCGSVRIKNPAGIGGSGQAVVSDLRQFDTLLASAAFAGPWRGGLVLERNLHRVQTVSIGQVQVAHWRLSYHGRQHLTRNHRGDEVYGGSSLVLVRGDFDALLATRPPPALRLAIEQALVYHRAALAGFEGLFASRSNYDVAQGVDDAGTWRSGVLEQSWRIGGASGAEVAALHALKERPALRWVQASTHELYADDAVLPAGAQVHFDGCDAKVGRMLKYVLVQAHGDD